MLILTIGCFGPFRGQSEPWESQNRDWHNVFILESGFKASKHTLQSPFVPILGLRFT